ncbi:MAG: DUF6515 family protein [Ginsengibacter sp.]
MKNIFKILPLSVFFVALFTSSNAQRRVFRESGNSRSGSISRTPSAPRQMESRSEPVRTFSNNSPSRVQSAPSRQITVRQAPDRNFNQTRVSPTRNLSTPSSNQRVYAQRNNSTNDRLIVSRNNSDRMGNYDRNRMISRNVYDSRNSYNRGYDRDNHYYRGYDRDDHYYGYVYGRRTRFMYGTRYRYIPHNFISIHFGGYPYYYYGGYFYGYYNGFYEPIFPPFGIHISVLPFGYVRLFIGGIPYYYYNGIYYRHYDDYYQVVDAPMGAMVSSLPNGARSVIINGESLYELNGTFYKPEVDDNGNQVFEVVGKNGVINNTPVQDNSVLPDAAPLQIGDMVSQLPEGSKIVTINGEQIYETPDNVYLKEENVNGQVEYQVVGK